METSRRKRLPHQTRQERMEAYQRRNVNHDPLNRNTAYDYGTTDDPQTGNANGTLGHTNHRGYAQFSDPRPPAMPRRTQQHHSRKPFQQDVRLHASSSPPPPLASQEQPAEEQSVQNQAMGSRNDRVNPIFLPRSSDLPEDERIRTMLGWRTRDPAEDDSPLTTEYDINVILSEEGHPPPDAHQRNLDTFYRYLESTLPPTSPVSARVEELELPLSTTVDNPQNTESGTQSCRKLNIDGSSRPSPAGGKQNIAPSRSRDPSDPFQDTEAASQPKKKQQQQIATKADTKGGAEPSLFDVPPLQSNQAPREQYTQCDAKTPEDDPSHKAVDKLGYTHKTLKAVGGKDKGRPACGHGEVHPLVMIFVGVRRLFLSDQGGTRILTWPGLISMIILSWLIAEIAITEYFGTTMYASTMRGYGVCSDSPRYPFAVITLATWMPPLSWLSLFF